MSMKQNSFLIMGMVFFGLACSPKVDNNKKTTVSRNEYTMAALNWMQISGEYRALCYQAFNVARMTLDVELSKKPAKKPAVVVDIDETVLDNSPYQARQIANGEQYPVGWQSWTDEAKAMAVPGAKEFLNYAVSKGADVFYITNRRPSEAPGTLNNLRSLGFPQADTLHIMFREAESNKEARRRKVSETHSILVLCGDNLNDLSDAYDGRLNPERNQRVDQMKNEWGHRFIVLPNPLYGDWDGAMFNYNFNLSDAAKDSARKAVLRMN